MNCFEKSENRPMQHTTTLNKNVTIQYVKNLTPQSHEEQNLLPVITDCSCRGKKHTLKRKVMTSLGRNDNFEL